MGTLHLHFQQLKWAAEFKCGCTGLEADPHKKRATPPEIIKQVQDMIWNDQQIKVHETAETKGASNKRVGYFLHEELRMKKLCARWVQLQ
jgi:hypothetical protein